MHPKSEMRIVFTGDVSFSEYFTSRMEDDSCLACDIREYLQSADYVVVNVENPITTQGFERTVSHLHSSPPETGPFLSRMNMRIWNLGNNHIMDCSSVGIDDTLNNAADNCCFTIGAGKNLEMASKAIVLGESIKVGILSIAKPWEFVRSDIEKPGALTWDRTAIIDEQVQELRKNVDWIVFVVHGGDEFSNLPMPYIRDRYIKLLNLGADIIVGHHPHVVQNYEYIENKLIVYSLGNFIFDTDYQRSFSYTDTGILLGIQFTKKNYSIDHLPVLINRVTQSVEVGKTPVVYCEIDANDYLRIWPLAARSLKKVNDKKWLLTQKRFSCSNRLVLLVHNIFSYRHKNNWIILKGRLLCLLHRRKESENISIQEYIQK